MRVLGMNFEDYKSGGKQAYLELASTVKELLEQTLNAAGGYRLQQIQFRAKSEASLESRLSELGQLGSETIEEHRKDLAGCRIVFYTNGDVERFTRSGLLSELFGVDWERMRVHHPKPGEERADKLFQSTNYVVRLKDDRTRLLEYAHLAGLACEVQVQTSLTHAWAEMAHDTVYKRPLGQGFGTREMETIERRLHEAMRDYLVPAGHIFQKISSDMDRLLAGKALFDEGAIQAVSQASDNNDRYEALKRLKEDVLPHMDELEAEFPKIMQALCKIWAKADTTSTRPYVTPHGEFPGNEGHEVTGLICDIFRNTRYIGLSDLFSAVQDLYARTQSDTSKSQLVDLTESMASHTMQVWQRAGPWAQSQLSEMLAKLEGDEDHAAIDIAAAAEILKSDVSGTTSSSSSMTWHSGSVIFSEALRAARGEAIAYLFRALGKRRSDERVAAIFSALFEAALPPNHGRDDTSLMQLILDDTAKIVQQLIPWIEGLALEPRRALERKVHTVWRRYHQLPDYLAKVSEVCAAQEKLAEAIAAFRKTISAGMDYVFHKTLIGYGSILDEMWDDPDQHHEIVGELRAQAQDDFLARITEKTWPEWKERIVHAASTDFSDGADIPPFERFVGALAKQQPDLTLDLLRDREAVPDWTIRSLVQGLWQTDHRNACKDLLVQWIGEGLHLRHIAVPLIFLKDINPDLVQALTDRTVAISDVSASSVLLELAARRFSEDEEFYRDRVFMPCLGVVAKAQNHDWVARTWFSADGQSVFASLNENDRKQVLQALVPFPVFDHHLETILAPLTKAAPDEVLNWIGERMRYSENNSDTEHTDLPFKFFKLGHLLRPYPDLVVKHLMYFAADETLTSARWSLSHFLSRIFDEHLDELVPHLLDFIDRAVTDDLHFLAEHIEGFEGASELLPVFKAILSSPAVTDEIERQVDTMYFETGVMSGQYGPAETYQQKADAMREWARDDNPRVSTFARKQIRQYEAQAASETRRADQELAQRQLDYGESLKPRERSGEEDDY